MSKPLKIKLSIPNPCNQDWDKMTITEKGKFCERCSNIITDFSNFTDRELIEYLSKAKDKICGRFHNTQLDRLIVQSIPSNTPLFHKILFGTALAAGVASIANGQSNPVPQKTIKPVNSKNSDEQKIMNERQNGDSINTISGIVVDSVGSPIYYANVTLMSQHYIIGQAISGKDGQFSIEIDSSLRGNTAKLIIEKQGYGNERLEIKIDKFPIKKFEISLLPERYFTLGQVATNNRTEYIIDGKKKVIKDTILSQSPEDFKKEIINRHLGTPASEEGTQSTNK